MTSTSRVGTLPAIPGMLSADDVWRSGLHLAQLQCTDGMVPWNEGGHCDPWNHVEAAMALTVCGLLEEADGAFEWLARAQLGDGSWFNYYLADRVEDARIDTNTCAYVATGAYHHYLVTGDLAALSRRFEMLSGALDFVLSCQVADGTVRWSRDATGRLEGYALLTGSSSIYHALRCGVAAAEVLGRARPDWELAAGRLGHAIAHHPEAFAPKHEYAMDWYYPVLAGALSGAAASERLARGWPAFVLERRGVRCVSTSDWVTAAETAECALTLEAVGRRADALALLSLTLPHRCEDGSYFTGIAYPELVTFPGDETTSYTAAAVILAADALSAATAGSGLFRGDKLVPALDLPTARCAVSGSGSCRLR